MAYASFLSFAHTFSNHRAYACYFYDLIYIHFLQISWLPHNQRNKNNSHKVKQKHTNNWFGLESNPATYGVLSKGATSKYGYLKKNRNIIDKQKCAL